MVAQKRILSIFISVTVLLSMMISTAANAAPHLQTSIQQDHVRSNEQNSVSTDDISPEVLLPADPPAGGHVVNEGMVQAAGLMPSNIFDPDAVGWASYRNYSSSAFSDLFDQMKDDYLMLDIEVDEINGQQRVSAVWQWNHDNRGWYEYRNLTSSEFHDKWVELKDSGYRLIDQEAYTLNGNRRYAGIWVQNKENLSWASWRNLTSAEFSEKFAEYSEAGYIMVDVEGYSTADGLRYGMIWVENSENLEWAEWRNLSTDDFSDKFNQLKDTHRMWDVESYRHNGTQYYAGIWVENQNGRGWAEYRDMSAAGYRNRWYRMRDLGYRLIDFEVYPADSGHKYAGIWRQNNERPDWFLKNDVNELVEHHFNDNDLVGLGVAISQHGEIKYIRGFGHQDKDAGVWYSGRTLNRLASVAKLVSGVLTLHLTEQGDINDIDDATASYVPTMPGHHTHSLRQILANRSGIGHYSAYSVPSQQYDSALAAAQTFWDTDSNPNQNGTQLVYTPGAGCIYSTHGHTILGAALEGATGKTIANIVEDELASPFGLSTLQVEDRDDGDANRSTLYDEDNDEVGADNISWKVLGGGLESSPYDLVRFGMKMLNGSVIDDDSLNELQQVPAPTNCTDPNWGSHNNYALGLQAGTHKGTPVMWKGGNQRGANTNMRLYPEKDIVIVVLANRNENHSTGSLATDIGALLLDNERSIEIRPVISIDLVRPENELADPQRLQLLEGGAADEPAPSRAETDESLFGEIVVPVDEVVIGEETRDEAVTDNDRPESEENSIFLPFING